MTKIEKVKMNVAGNFWTHLNELVSDLEDLDYTVTEYNYEYISVTDDLDDCEEYVLYLGHANRTMWIEKVKAA